MDPEKKLIHSIVSRLTGEEEERRPGASLKEALGLGQRELISLVGGGGKTTLMFRLANELVLGGKRVITTTTTRILEPSPEESPLLLVEADERKAKELCRQGLDALRHVTLARENLEGKLKGVSPDLIGELWQSSWVDYLIVEADGAAGRPIKAPREWEPVIPAPTTLVVAIMGMDGMGAELKEENVFQPERVSRLTGLRLGQRMTEAGMADLMAHPEGLFRGVPDTSRVAAFLNKVDLAGRISNAREVARRICNKKHRQIERVVLGQVKKEPPVAEVIFP